MLETAPTGTAEEASQLKHCINDLISLNALPATWSGAEPEPILRSLVDALIEVLPLDFVYVGLSAGVDRAAIELSRSIAPATQAGPAHELGALLRRALGDDTSAWPAYSKLLVGGTETSLAILRLGMQSDSGVLVAAAERVDLSQPIESLLLNVATNQAVIALQNATLLAEERRRVKDRSWRSVIDGIPGFVATLTPNGAVESVNRQILEYTGQGLDGLKDWGTNGTVHPDDMPHVAGIFGRAIAEGSHYDIEQRLRRHDGEYRWFGNRGIPESDASGQIVRWYVLLTDIHERRQAEETLRAREVELRKIVDNIPVLISLLSPAGEVLLSNRQILDYSGRSVEELEKWGTSDLVHGDDIRHAADTFKQGIRAGEPFEIVYRMRRHDGAYRWFEGRHRPMKDPEGRVYQWCVSVNDIDDRKRAEDAVAENERRLQLIIDTIPALAWSASPDGAAEFFNRHYQEYSGCSSGQLEGAGWVSRVHPDDRATVLRTWEAMLATGQGGECEARLRRFDDQYRWLLFRTNPLHDEAGTIVRWYGINIDIEDLKRTEEKLKRSEAFLAEGQRLSSMGSFVWRPQTDELTFSEELYRVFELDLAAPLTLERIAERVHPEDVPLLNAKVEEARAGLEDHDYDIRLQLPDGRTKYLRTVARSASQPGAPLEYLGTIQDITERQLAEDALGKVRSELAHVTRTMSLGVLTASIAHEVNQPLAGIVTNANTCLRKLASNPPDVKGALDTARRTIRDANRASEVITRLSALFRSRDAASDAVDLNESTREVISLFLQDLQRRRISLQTDLDQALPHVRGNRVQLQQVILNLLSNAADAMKGIEGRPRQISIRTTREHDGTARLFVQDTGSGIPAEAGNKLFDAFYTTKENGMGIGLSVSRSIVESHQGRLWCQPNDGPGATFAFSIPVTCEV